MFDYWIISAPPEPTCEETWKNLSQALSKFSDCACFKFHIPHLKVGTLGQLLVVSDELAKLETVVEGLVTKIALQLDELLEGKREKVVDEIHADNVPPHDYLVTFKWDMAKYPTRQSIKTISYLIEKQISTCEADLTAKVRTYHMILANYTACEKKRSANLLTKFIGDFVSKDDFVLDSEFLTTLVVVVSSGSKQSWLDKYERLHPEVVPKSTNMITEDYDHALFTVTIFKRAQDAFKLAAKEKGFFVRDFVYNEEEIFLFRQNMHELYQEKLKLYQPLLKFCKVNFGECFIALIHVKASRLYVESVLRFGLPPNFQPILLVIPQKMVNKVRKCLDNLYTHLDPMRGRGSKSKLEPHPLLDVEYYPYVYTKIKADLGDILAKK